MEMRKKEEIEYHNKLRGLYEQDPDLYARYTRNKKYYSITERSRRFIHDWLLEHGRGNRVLEFGCGGTPIEPDIDGVAHSIVRIDISDESLRICRNRADVSISERAEQGFSQMDCERLGFADDSFDVIVVSGVLHHLDVQRAYPELARVLHPDGVVICIEALGHNPIIQLYRTLTPHLRTKWESEHILKMKDIRRAQSFFNRVDMKRYHFLTLLAVPFRNWNLFRPVLRMLEWMDDIILSIPLVRNQAWQIVFFLRNPRKS